MVAPGLTIRDRPRVLRPNDPDSYYQNRELAPADLLADLAWAKIVITNYHALKQRERLGLSKGGRPCSRAAAQRSAPSKPKDRCSSGPCLASWA